VPGWGLAERSRGGEGKKLEGGKVVRGYCTKGTLTEVPGWGGEGNRKLIVPKNYQNVMDARVVLVKTLPMEMFTTMAVGEGISENHT